MTTRAPMARRNCALWSRSNAVDIRDLASTPGLPAPKHSHNSTGDGRPWDDVGGATFPLFGVGLEKLPRRFAPRIEVVDCLRDDRRQQRPHRLKFFIGQDKDLYPLGDHVLLPPFLGLVPFLAEVDSRLWTCRTDDESFEIIGQFLEFFWIQ